MFLFNPFRSPPGEFRFVPIIVECADFALTQDDFAPGSPLLALYLSGQRVVAYRGLRHHIHGAVGQMSYKYSREIAARTGVPFTVGTFPEGAELDESLADLNIKTTADARQLLKRIQEQNPQAQLDPGDPHTIYHVFMLGAETLQAGAVGYGEAVAKTSRGILGWFSKAGVCLYACRGTMDNLPGLLLHETRHAVVDGRQEFPALVDSGDHMRQGAIESFTLWKENEQSDIIGKTSIFWDVGLNDPGATPPAFRAGTYCDVVWQAIVERWAE